MGSMEDRALKLLFEVWGFKRVGFSLVAFSHAFVLGFQGLGL